MIGFRHNRNPTVSFSQCFLFKSFWNPWSLKSFVSSWNLQNVNGIFTVVLELQPWSLQILYIRIFGTPSESQNLRNHPRMFARVWNFWNLVSKNRFVRPSNKTSYFSHLYIVCMSRGAVHSYNYVDKALISVIGFLKGQKDNLRMTM